MRLASKIEHSAELLARTRFVRFGFLSLFFVMIMLYFQINPPVENSLFLTVAAVMGAYMALNIGANDSANNVGPAVGANALKLTTAIMIAMVFEASGAFLAGGDVIETIKKDIIHIELFEQDIDRFVWAMMSALIGAALWLNLATMARVPVSTTYSIVGGVVGSGIAAAGFEIIKWQTMAKISASWVVSPVIGGLIAAIFLFSITKRITNKPDKVAASVKWVPVYVAIMAWAFVTYIWLKAIGQFWPDLMGLFDISQPHPLAATPSYLFALILGFLAAFWAFLVTKKRISAKRNKLDNSLMSVNKLFNIPVIFAAALLSFAHGANDIANVIGPLAAINEALMVGNITDQVGVPFWVMAIGAFGIVAGLALYGSRMIKTVGSEITDLDQIRAFSVAMAASVTVIVASQLGLPVSSTHIVIGGIFGVGLMREWLDARDRIRLTVIQDQKLIKRERRTIVKLNKEISKINDKTDKGEPEFQRILDLYRLIDNAQTRLNKAIKSLEKDRKILYVKRDAIKTIVMAWVVTVPAAAVIAATAFYLVMFFVD